jgi:hypothetical protein
MYKLGVAHYLSIHHLVTLMYACRVKYMLDIFYRKNVFTEDEWAVDYREDEEAEWL